MTALIDSLIGGEVLGHQTHSLDETANDTAPVLPPDRTGGVVTPSTGAPLSTAALIDREAIGWSGPSLDGYTPVAYRAESPGFGGFNDQPWQSGPANFSPGVVPSQEVGTGKPPGWIAAHMPVAQGTNPPRSSYVYQGVFADGQEYIGQGGPSQEVSRNRTADRVPAWLSMYQPGQQPSARALSQWPGSAVVEVPASYSLAELLGRVAERFPHNAGNVAYGVQ